METVVSINDFADLTDIIFLEVLKAYVLISKSIVEKGDKHVPEFFVQVSCLFFKVCDYSYGLFSLGCGRIKTSEFELSTKFPDRLFGV